jgi:hypothetical protein
VILRSRVGQRWRSARGCRSRCRDTIQPFPTFSEIYLAALKALRAEIAAADQPVA